AASFSATGNLGFSSSENISFQTLAGKQVSLITPLVDVTLDMDVGGHASIGPGSSISADTTLAVSETFDDAGGIVGKAVLAFSATATGNVGGSQIIGSSGNVFIGAVDGDVTGLVAGNSAFFGTFNPGAHTIDNEYGFYSQYINFGGTGTTVTDVVGFYADGGQQIFGDLPTITRQTGVWVAEQLYGTTKYGVVVDSDSQGLTLGSGQDVTLTGSSTGFDLNGADLSTAGVINANGGIDTDSGDLSFKSATNNAIFQSDVFSDVKFSVLDGLGIGFELGAASARPFMEGTGEFDISITGTGRVMTFAPTITTVNPFGYDIDFLIKGDTKDLFFVDAGADTITLGGDLTSNSDLTTTGTVTWSGGGSANANSAYSHISATGASHSYINQAVLTTSSVAFGEMV
ncbi:unnamed protein product, partial [marine sediment metagenome]